MRVVRLQGIEAKQVGDCDIGWVVLLVRLRKSLAVDAQQTSRLFIAHFGPQRVSQTSLQERIASASRRPALVVGLGKWCRIGTADDEVQSGEPGRDQGGVLDPVCIERIPEDLLQPQAAGRVVAVPRQVDERGDVAGAVIVTREEPQLLAFLKMQNLVDGMSQFVERHLHQLVARIVLENLDHVSAGVAG